MQYKSKKEESNASKKENNAAVATFSQLKCENRKSLEVLGYGE